MDATYFKIQETKGWHDWGVQDSVRNISYDEEVTVELFVLTPYPKPLLVRKESRDLKQDWTAIGVHIQIYHGLLVL